MKKFYKLFVLMAVFALVSASVISCKSNDDKDNEPATVAAYRHDFSYFGKDYRLVLNLREDGTYITRATDKGTGEVVTYETGSYTKESGDYNNGTFTIRRQFKNVSGIMMSDPYSEEIEISNGVFTYYAMEYTRQ